MKKILVCLSLTALGFAAMAQNADTKKADNKRGSFLGVSFFLNDYTTAQRIRSTSLTTVLNDKRVAKFREMSPGIGITYFKGLSNFIDFAGTIGGSFPRITQADQSFSSGDKFLFEADASANLKMFSERYIFTPYLIAGIGVSHVSDKFDAFIPLGLGFKANILDEAAIFLNGQYRVPVTTQANNYHFQYGLGFAGLIGKKKEVPVIKEVVIPQAPKDTDNDGINDDVDKCPTVAGVAKYQGCPIPDADRDGINDEEDKCPTVAGLAKYQGCPIPDTDNDGINDEQDKCPTVAGVAKYQGCPIPDTDGDGINDDEDRCPNLAGTRENNGCPEVKIEVVKRMEYAAQRIYFATGSSKLLSKSFTSLNDVVKIMNEDKDLKLSIEGHTDNVGKDDYNQTLSESRAASVKQYLLSKGVDESRLTSQGFGETTPIADNKTTAGKAKNRRVVMRATYE